MRDSKLYLAFGAIILAALFLQLHMPGEGHGEVRGFRGANLDEEVFNPLIASSVNDNLLSVVIDNQQYTNEEYAFYMDDNLNVMVPVEILREALGCSAHVYGDGTLLVEKHSKAVSMRVGEARARVNGEEEEMASPLVERDGKYYVSLNDLSRYLDYGFAWDIGENLAVAVDNAQSASIFPTRYDLRERGRVSRVRDQGSYGTCWAFAALGALESTLLPEQEALFSADHMTLCNGFSISPEDGGEYTIGMAYLAAWKGPVFEVDDPYGDDETDDTLPAVKHVQEMQVIDGKDYEKIKAAVFQYGGVQTSIYNALRSSLDDSPYYDSRTSSYCYIGTEKPNHDVVIIGWDDSYPKENFSVDLEGDGAFLCQNSWGEEFGEDGVFYVSYYDTNIGTHNVVYTGVEDPGNYGHIYQSDLCGWVGQIGYIRDGMYGANVYTAGGAEELVAAGFYATGKDSQYEVYVVRHFKDESSLQEMVPVASGKFGNAGYYTVRFHDGIELEPGERFAVVLHIITPNSLRPMAVEYRADEATAGVVLDDGESYISASGATWQNVNAIEECNLCIKAFTNDR